MGAPKRRLSGGMVSPLAGQVGPAGSGLEDVPHLVASALLPDSPQQDGSSPRYAQLNIHERLSAQSVPAVKRILHRHTYKYSPERKIN